MTIFCTDYYRDHKEYPRTHAEKLSIWVHNVRQRYYNRLEGGAKSKINQEQVETLDAWGFDWTMTRDTLNVAAVVTKTDWNEVRRLK
jgi:hypothetical protein